MKYQSKKQQEYIERFEADSGVSVVRENIALRKLNMKALELSNGKRVYNFHTKHVHFERDGEIHDIDTDLKSVGDKYEMTEAAYQLDFVKSLSKEAPFTFKNKNAQFGLVPRGLRWNDKTVVHQDVNNVSATKRKNVVTFKDGLGQGNDLVFEAANTGLRKIVKINSAPAVPKGVTHLEAGFEIVVSDRTEIWVNDFENQEKVDAIRAKLLDLDKQRLLLEKTGNYKEARKINEIQERFEAEIHDVMLSKWDKKTDLTFEGEFQFIEDGVKTYGRTPMVWDSAGRAIHIDVQLRSRKGKMFFAKMIPVEFLEEALFPIYTDATNSYYAGAGDGYVRNHGAGTWATLRGAGTGTYADYTSSSFLIQAYDYGSGRDIKRGFYPTNTSGIDDGDTIDSASLYLYTGYWGANGNADTTSIDVVQTSQASTTTLATTDFGSVTFTDGGNKAISTFSGSGAYGAIALNATGLTYITKTGTTKIGCLVALDTDNTAPTGDNKIYPSSSEDSSTTRDPYLSVTSTPAGTNYTKTLTETSVLSEGVAKKPAKVLTEVISTVAAIVRDTAKGLANNTISLTDTVTNASVFTKAITETITMIDTVAQRITAKMISEVMTLVDTVSNSSAITRSFVETITLVETTATVRMFYRTVTETLSLVDSCAKTFVAGRTFTESLGVSDHLFGKINGVNMMWKNKYTDQVATWIKKYLDF